jgi:hypothetical protein
MMGELRPPGQFANESANTQELAPVRGCGLRIEPRLARLEAVFRILDPPGSHHGFAGGKVGLDRVGRRHTGCLREGICHRHCLVIRAASDRELHAQDF